MSCSILILSWWNHNRIVSKIVVKFSDFMVNIKPIKRIRERINRLVKICVLWKTTVARNSKKTPRILWEIIHLAAYCEDLWEIKASVGDKAVAIKISCENVGFSYNADYVPNKPFCSILQNWKFFANACFVSRCVISCEKSWICILVGFTNKLIISGLQNTENSIFANLLHPSVSSFSCEMLIC